MFDAEKYFRRIAYSGNPKADYKTLSELHQHHVHAIPFENLHIMSGQRINLETDFLFHKIIEKKRGGVCYELNALFYELLVRLGFRVHMHSAITLYGDEYGDEFDHMSLTVECDRSHWLVDVGLREPMLRPVSLFNSATLYNSRKVYRDSHGFFHMLKPVEDGWVEEYKFNLTTRLTSEFMEMCRFHESNPKSPLNRYLLCSIATEDGRLVVKGNRMIRECDGILSVDALTRDKQSYDRLETFCKPFSFTRDTVEHLFFAASKSGTIAA